MSEENVSQAQPAPRIDVEQIIADESANRSQLGAAAQQCTIDIANIDSRIRDMKQQRRDQKRRAAKGNVRVEIEELTDARSQLITIRSQLEGRLSDAVRAEDVARARRKSQEKKSVERIRKGLLTSLRSIPARIAEKAASAKSVLVQTVNADYLRELNCIRDMSSDPKGQADAASAFLERFNPVLHAKTSGIDKDVFITAFLDAIQALQENQP